MKLSHAELVSRGARWLRQKGCRIVFSELKALTPEIPDVIGWVGSTSASFLIEAKASRSDFIADVRKTFRQHPAEGAGQYRFYISQPDVIAVDDLPEKWGLLHVHGKTIRIVRGQDPSKTGWPDYPWQFKEYNYQAERIFMLSALRRLQIHHGQSVMDEIVHETYTAKQTRRANSIGEVDSNAHP